MTEMIKICENCNGIMSYDSYFKAYMCRKCGHKQSVSITKSHRVSMPSLARKHSQVIMATASSGK